MGGCLDLIRVGEGDQPLVKGPVAQVAERQPVAGVVVVADAPGDDVGGGHGGVSIGGEDAHAADGAAMVVGSDDGAAEALVADPAGEHLCFLVALFDHIAGFGQQFLAVLVRFGVNCALLQQNGVQFGGEVALDEDGAQQVAWFGAAQQGVEVIIQAGAQDERLQRGQAGVGPVHGEGGFLPRPGQQMPEPLTLQVVEGIREHAPLAGRPHPVPIQGKQLTQLRRQFDQIGGDAALLKEVEDG